MKKYNLAIQAQCQDVIYSPVSASQLARVSLEFLRECEREGLIQSQQMIHGESGYHLSEIRKLARIRRLRETLALDLAAIEVVLHLRQQVSDLMEGLGRMEQQMAHREQELLNEIQALRHHLAEEVDWTS